jgi:hypothetical protein
MKITDFVTRPAIAGLIILLALALPACKPKDNPQQAADVGTSDPLIAQLTREIQKQPKNAALYFSRLR